MKSKTAHAANDPPRLIEIETIDRDLLGKLQFEHGLRMYEIGGRFVVFEDEYNECLKRQQKR